jgi:hypothetical protein
MGRNGKRNQEYGNEKKKEREGKNFVFAYKKQTRLFRFNRSVTWSNLLLLAR